jgi:hypothetical protein
MCNVSMGIVDAQRMHHRGSWGVEARHAYSTAKSLRCQCRMYRAAPPHSLAGARDGLTPRRQQREWLRRSLPASHLGRQFDSNPKRKGVNMFVMEAHTRAVCARWPNAAEREASLWSVTYGAHGATTPRLTHPNATTFIQVSPTRDGGSRPAPLAAGKGRGPGQAKSGGRRGKGNGRGKKGGGGKGGGSKAKGKGKGGGGKGNRRKQGRSRDERKDDEAYLATLAQFSAIVNARPKRSKPPRAANGSAANNASAADLSLQINMSDTAFARWRRRVRRQNS